MGDAKRIVKAAGIAARYGGTDGAHHKQGVIDQMLRVLLAPAVYEAFVRGRTAGPDGEGSAVAGSEIAGASGRWAIRASMSSP
jgi:hypothetical protein